MATLFKKLPPPLARLQTLAHRHLRGLSFEAGGRLWTVEASAARVAHGLTAYGTLGAGEFILWLNDPDWAVAAASVLDVQPAAAAAFPDALVSSALECFASDILARVEKASGLPLALTRLERETAPPVASACSFLLRRDDGLAVGGAWAVTGGDGGGWRDALEKALSGIPIRPSPLPGGLPFAGVVALAAWSAPRSVLADLAPGDVLLTPAGPEWFLTVGRALRFAARLEKGVLLVEGKTMTQAAQAPEGAAPEALTALDAVEVELQAQVGRLTVTLAQLRELGTGQVVEFGTPVETPATILAGGKAVATGELVDVGGRVGVRITSLAEG